MRKDNWCIKITENNREIVKNFFKDKVFYTCSFSVGAFYGYCDNEWHSRFNNDMNWQVISYDEFLRTCVSDFINYEIC